MRCQRPGTYEVLGFGGEVSAKILVNALERIVNRDIRKQKAMIEQPGNQTDLPGFAL